jgi:general secretion pathway protein I
VRAELRSFRHDQRGFTLIEVVVALIVVSLGMLAVIETVGGTARNSSYLRDKTIAHWVAMNKLTEVRVLPNAPAVDKTSDEVEMAGRDWRWTMEVKQTQVESIRRIDISVRPAEAPDKSSMASISGFYGAAVAPAGTTLINWRGDGEQGGQGGRQRQRGEQDDPNDDNRGGQNPGVRPPQPDLEPGEVVPPEPEPEPQE